MTIKDLSAQTGYSVGTISRVLNDHPNVSEKARKTILEAAAASAFQLNTNAQQLKRQRTNEVLVLVKGSANQLFSSLVEAIQARMAATPYHLVVDYMDESANEVLRAVRLVRERKPRGLLFLGGNRENFLADLGRIDLPCVVVTSDGSSLPFRNLSSICTDDPTAVRQALEQLIGMGHRSIAVIGGPLEGSDTSRRRYEGCLAAFKAHDLPFIPAMDYCACRYSYQGGYEAAVTLLGRGRDHSAIFCMSDVMAMGAIRALTDRGLRVPEDVSVMGFDGLAIGEYIVPRLSTIRQSVEALASRSVELLLQNCEGGHICVHETIPAQLHWRESTMSLL